MASEADLERQAEAIAQEQVPQNVPAAARAAKVQALKQQVLQRLRSAPAAPSAPWQAQQGAFAQVQKAQAAMPQPAVNSSVPAAFRGGALMQASNPGLMKPGGLLLQKPQAPPPWEGKADPYAMLGDAAWFTPPKARSAPLQPVIGGCGGHLPQHVPALIQPPGAAPVPPGAVGGVQASPSEKAAGEESEELASLKRITTMLGCELTEKMRRDPRTALFEEACRLLMAVLGFMCEGNVAPMLRSTVVTKGPFQPAFQGVVPHMMLREWFETNDSKSLLSLFSQDCLRQAFEAAEKSRQAQFVTLLSRAASVEVLRPGMNSKLRAPWQKILDTFPEVLIFRALVTHVRLRCWEDARDRSRSRSPKRKVPELKIEKEDGVRFCLKNTGLLGEEEIMEYFQSYGRIVSCNVLVDKKKGKPRGVAFLTLKPEGEYEGEKITEASMAEWIMSEEHIVGHMRIEITQAEVKQEEDEDKKREERVEERKRARVEKEQRMSRALVAPHLREGGEEKLVPSHWLRRWRRDIWEFFPKGPQGSA
eukprot:TRINITY_DN9660_c0_g1_i2.p1 TRINITY_DN9660_c0_g1~~TRINITY_DN9660_c0_g1_i2.p1  ORF type:complete len:545 (-),score=112.45 TRINITY_DN9660_c0_g1_i2:74-1675(-)